MDGGGEGVVGGEALKEVLVEQRRRFVVEGEGGKVGFRMVAWVAVARK